MLSQEFFKQQNIAGSESVKAKSPQNLNHFMVKSVHFKGISLISRCVRGDTVNPGNLFTICSTLTIRFVLLTKSNLTSWQSKTEEAHQLCSSSLLYNTAPVKYKKIMRIYGHVSEHFWMFSGYTSSSTSHASNHQLLRTAVSWRCALRPGFYWSQKFSLGSGWSVTTKAYLLYQSCKHTP